MCSEFLVGQRGSSLVALGYRLGGGSGLRRCSHVLPLQQDAGDPKQPVADCVRPGRYILAHPEQLRVVPPKLLVGRRLRALVIS
jgi:hypothetical protein